MRIAFVDLETTGLPIVLGGLFGDYKQTQLYDTSRLIQITVIIYEFNTDTQTFAWVSDENFYVNPGDDVEIRGTHIHHIDRDKITKLGAPLQSIMKYLSPILARCEWFIAHNVEFDFNVLASEVYRGGMHETLQHLTRMKKFCTCQESTSITQIRKLNNTFKRPTLTELYEFLFKATPKNLHDAYFDTQHLVRCFIELHAKKHIEFKDARFVVSTAQEQMSDA